jgi:hypothetical protein
VLDLRVIIAIVIIAPKGATTGATGLTGGGALGPDGGAMGPDGDDGDAIGFDGDGNGAAPQHLVLTVGSEKLVETKSAQFPSPHAPI